MLHMLAIYLILAGIALSIWHSVGIMRKAGRPGAPVNDLLLARREKKILVLSGLIDGAHIVGILLLSVIWPELVGWVVIAPFLYLVAWSVPRLLSGSRD